MQRIAWLMATWFGCGLAPAAPGTAGSLAAVAIAYLLNWSRVELAAAAVLILAPAIWAAGRFASASGVEDPGQVVVDEVAGQWLALCGATHYTWLSVALGFGLFRLFDVWKPFPARQLESLPGGLGIVADDLAAGLWAALVLFAAGWFNLY